MDGISLNINCDWCGGEVEMFKQAKSGMRCKMCWRTEGKKEEGLHIVERSDPEHYLNKEVKKE